MGFFGEQADEAFLPRPSVILSDVEGSVGWTRSRELRVKDWTFREHFDKLSVTPQCPVDKKKPHRSEAFFLSFNQSLMV
jgi:hypothetical protein